jgi:flagellin
MGLRINTNVDAASSGRRLGIAQAQLSVGLARLASGKRINQAADDPAGLAIAQLLTSQVRGVSAAVRNAQDGISLVQTADGALAQASDTLQRIRELTVQAGNGTLSSTDRGAIQAEITQLQGTLDNTANQTQFNGKQLLNGTTASVQIQVGANPNETAQVSLPDANAAALGVGPGQVDVSSPAAAQASLTSVDQAIASVNQARGTLGAQQGALQSTAASLNVAGENQLSARSRIEDLDYAQGVSNRIRDSLLSDVGTAMLAHANMNASSVLRLLS